MPLFAFARRILRDCRTEPPPAAPPEESAEPDPFHALPPAERRLLAVVVSLRGPGAIELLDLLSGTRGERLRRAEAVLSTVERGRRRALLSRELAREPSTGRDARSLDAALKQAPAWFRAQACAELPAEVRETLLIDPAVRRAWGRLSAHHPALTRWARRRLVSLRFGSVFRGGTEAVPSRNTQRLRRFRPA